MFNAMILILGFSNPPYWYNSQIHNMGNIGILGNIHAISSPFITKIIDNKAYSGRNIRKEIYNTFEGDVVDLCCGTGFSTKPGNVGVDTSLQMLRFTNLFNPGSNYKFGNAENYGLDKEFDIVSCMFAFHEMPSEGHKKVIRNCIRIAKKEIIIVDISTNYKPSNMMLSGEPYIKDYLQNIDETMYNHGFKKNIFLEDHVDIWKYKI